MIRGTVKNFRGCASARFEIPTGPSGICLLAGRNGSGKSSTASAVAAALTGAPIAPSFELKKADIKALIRDGTTAAECRLDRLVDDRSIGHAVMSYPKGELVTQGDPPRASLYAAGIASLLDLPIKERGAALAPYLKAEPVRDDLAAALPDFDAAIIDACWKRISDNGWDQTYQFVVDDRRRAAGAWEQASGERSFGSAKANSWQPEGWPGDDFFVGITEVELDARIADLKAQLERSIATTAVTQAQVERWEEFVAALPQRRRAMAEAKAKVEKLAAETEAAKAKRAALPPVGDASDVLACPHCQGAFIMNAGKPEKYIAPTGPEISQRRSQRGDADAEVVRIQGEHAAACKLLDERIKTLQEAVDAGDKLQAFAEKQSADPQPSQDTARLNLAEAERNSAMYRQVEAARAAYQRWEDADLFAKALTSERGGVRAKKLGDVLALFNEANLRALCETAKWEPIQIAEDFSIRVGGRLAQLAAESGTLRARIVLQVAMAQIDGSAMVVIDKADTLDPAHLNGLLDLLLEADMPALVCMMAGGPERIPDLTAAGIGETLWIEAARPDEGVARPIAEMREPAAA